MRDPIPSHPNVPDTSYYDAIAPGYNELHGEEQRAKYRLVRDILHDTFGLRADARVLDVGAGTGLGADIIWSVGVDPSPGLLAQHPHPDSVEGRAEHLPFGDKSFDAAISVSAIHHTDHVRAFHEMARISRGPLAITILKKSLRALEISKFLEKSMHDVVRVEEKKDIIFVGMPRGTPLHARKD